jgi:hypothetical protein
VSAGEGGQLPLTDPAVVRVRSNAPPGGWVVLYRDGTQVHRVQDQVLEYASDRPGTYRAEVWVPASGREGFVPWIVGNPIVVGPTESISAAPAPDMAGARFELRADGAMWGVEHDAGSRATIDRATGIGLTYTLASSVSPPPYAALVATTPVEPGAAGLAFVGRADLPMRLSVQVRVLTAGEGLRWQRSIYLDRNPREVVVPFGEMTAVGETPKGAPHLSTVGTVLFVADRVNTRPGSTGHFVIDDVRFYSPASVPAAK